MNEHDSERIAGLLEADGMVLADSADDADVIVLNTCCIRENADNKLYGALGNLKPAKADNPDLQIVVAGCLAQKDRERIQERAPHVDVVLGTHNVGRAAELLAESAVSGPLIEIWEQASDDEADRFPSALPTRRESDYAAWLTIQIGCDNSCAFCIVPSVRGAEISRPFGDLVAEAQHLSDAGVSEITLLGQNVNSYGRDLTLALRSIMAGTAEAGEVDEAEQRRRAGARWADSEHRARPLFADLLRDVAAVEGIRRVRYTSPHPKDLRPDTIAAMADCPEVCEHLHLPLQSGSDTVLAAMHRGYTAERYLERLAAAKAGIEDLAVTTDIIVGFPGETEADFEATLEVAAEAGYDSAYTFIYSPREGTEAAEMVDRYVDRAVVGERFDRLREVVDRSGRLRHAERVGRIEEIVVEGPSRRDPTMLTGRTRQNKLVHFSPPRPLRVGSYATVEVNWAGKHSLRGDFVEMVAPARHKTRIPVAAF
jgi:tRNA-2-methylthio-N6-dimethylallyladenosine synthase